MPNPNYRPGRRYRITRVRKAPVQLWLVEPSPVNAWGATQVHACGRRIVELPSGSWITATWREAINLVCRGKEPRPLTLVYPQWCGLLAEADA